MKLEDLLEKFNDLEQEINRCLWGDFQKNIMKDKMNALNANIVLCEENQIISKKEAAKMKALVNYYGAQYRLIGTFFEMHKHWLFKASQHDSLILRKLNTDLGREWRKIAAITQLAEKNEKMKQ